MCSLILCAPACFPCAQCAQVCQRRVCLALSSVLLVVLVLAAVRRHLDLRIPFHHPLAGPVGNTSFSPTPDRQIPPYVHYVFGLAHPSPKSDFNFIHYLCLTSALVVLKPEKIVFHYVHQPTSWYWQRFKLEVERHEATRLEMVRERDVTEVFGNEVEHYAHKADVLRLEALYREGGVYLDADVLVLRGTPPPSLRGIRSQSSR